MLVIPNRSEGPVRNLLHPYTRDHSRVQPDDPAKKRAGPRME